MIIGTTVVSRLLKAVTRGINLISKNLTKRKCSVLLKISM